MIASQIAVATLLLVASAQAEFNWQKMLLEDQVKFEGDKMISISYGLISSNDEQGDPTSLQVKFYSEAPAKGVISRDSFTSIFTTISLPIVLELGEMEPLEEPIGTVDMEINIIMTAKGVQIEVANNVDGTKNRNTFTWDQVFGNTK